MEINKTQFGPIYYIKSTIGSKYNGSKNPGVYIFKNGDETLYVGSAGDISIRLRSNDYQNYTKGMRNSGVGEPIIYTHIEQYITEDNFIAMVLEYILIRELRPKYNKEKLVTGWDIKGMHETYERSKPEDRYDMTVNLKHMLGEEEPDNSRQMDIEESWIKD